MTNRASQPSAWHSLGKDETLARLESSPIGLADREVAARFARLGPNVLPSRPPPGLLEIGLRQLRSPLIYVLLAAATGALLLGDLTDAAFIGVVLLVNSLLGGWQEWHAERESQGLQRLLRIRASVLREGAVVEIDASELVPGDVVALESGQRVPADLRLIDAHGLEVEEALLSGESLPVSKDADWIGEDAIALGDRRNMAYAGTTVARGRSHGVVVETAARTEVGRLALAMTGTEGGKPPLVARMERFSRIIAIAVLAAALAIGTLAVVLHGASVATMFMFGVALAVSAIPEGLPVAITVALAIASRRMAERGAIVRRLPAVEGLGSCTLIASDKTGTLTCNELTVRTVVLADGRRGQVSGAGYTPVGEISFDRHAAASAGDDASLQLVEVAAACNEADLRLGARGWFWRGDPTDVALLALAAKAGIDREALLAGRPLLNQIAFEPERRYAATFHAREHGTWIAVKGAPERVLAMCSMEPEALLRLQAAADDLAEQGQRVLALASGRMSHPISAADVPGEPRDLACVGLLGLMDPLRDGAAEAVARCADAGIRVIMVTGDHPRTALAIARDLGIATEPGEVVYGPDVIDGSGRGLRPSIETGRVYARVTPDQKLRIVQAAQDAGHFVAVTGDGVNDAPALRRANIGIAMGRGGTDVARDAADLVLSDDNFATIVAGVEEGRIAYRNIRNVVYLLVAAGTAEVLCVALAVTLGLPIPFLPVQLLWLNLVTNGIQDVALAFERGQGDELRSRPRASDEPVFNRLMIERIMVGGLWMGLLTFGAYLAMLEAGVALPVARNALLLLMVLLQNFDAFNARSETRSAFRIPLSSNPVLVGGVLLALFAHVLAMHLPLTQRVLEIAPVSAGTWLSTLVAAASLLLVMELQKRSWRMRRPGIRGSALEPSPGAE